LAGPETPKLMVDVVIPSEGGWFWSVAAANLTRAGGRCLGASSRWGRR
jgi:hypothetical protein